MGYGIYWETGRTKKEAEEKFERLRQAFAKMFWSYVPNVSGKVTRKLTKKEIKTFGIRSRQRYITIGHFDK